MRTSRRGPIAALLTCLALTAPLLAFASPASAADPTIRINEVESNGGSPGDWVELVNTGASPVDVSGWIIKDDNDGRTLAIADDTTIAPGGFLAVDVEGVPNGYGLGAPDAARVYLPDGTTLIDSYSWSTHAATTYGRCPDGTGAFVTTTSPTKGAANACPVAEPEPEPVPDVVINEVESNGGTPGDWIELRNNGASPVDVSGWIVKDDNDGRTLAIADETTIAPGGFLAVDVEGVPNGYGLGAPDVARVYLPDGTALVDSYSWTTHAATTYGRCPDGTGAFVTTTSSTKGAANDCPAPAGPSVVINEVESNGGTPGDWIELTNIGASPVDVSGWIVKDDNDGRTLAIADETTIAPGGFLAVDVEGVPNGYGLGAPDAARVYLPDGTTLIDSYSWSTHATTTYGRCPDGTGEFVTTTSSTKGAANDCPAPAVPSIVINEVESNGGTPGDWIELLNTGAEPVDVSGWIVKDDNDGRTSALPADSVVAPGEFFIIEESTMGFGLGTPDMARIFLPDGTTLVDSHSWGPHATTTYGRCPDGTGEFVTTTSPTKAAPNDCGPPVRINEVESNGDATDWIELVNNGSEPIDVSGWIVKDDNDGRTLAFPDGAMIPAGGHRAIDVDVDGDPNGFGLGAPDSARVFLPDGTTLVDSYSWTSHAATTYGRCPDGTGEFATTVAPTKGAANVCEGDLVTSPWPGGQDVTVADPGGIFTTNLSGLAHEATGGAGVLWAVKNGPGTLYRLLWDGSVWAPDTASGWTDGKTLHYPDGTGDVDAEGVGLTSAGAAGGVFVASERNNSVSGVSRPSVLRYDVSGAGTSLTATREWNLTADLPPLGPNLGLEAIAWIPDSFLVARGLLDESTGQPYDPADHPGHGSGLFFVGVEQNGMVYGYALDQSSSSYTRITSFSSGFTGVMDLEFEPDTGAFWVVCDDTCNGRSAIFSIAQEGPDAGRFVSSQVHERPSGMPNLNNEGFAITPDTSCVDGLKPVFWSDDTGTDGIGLRAGTVQCASGPVDPTEPVDPTGPTPVPTEDLTDDTRGPVKVPATASPGQSIVVSLGDDFADVGIDVWLHSTPAHLGTRITNAAGAAQVTIPSNASLGQHRIAVVGLDGSLIGWAPIRLVAASTAGGTGTLPNTGGSSAELLLAAIVLLGAGGIAVAAGRRRGAVR